MDGTLPAPEPGVQLRLAIEPRHLHWFDPASGQRVEAGHG
jgi:hypothetical protein